MMPESRKISRYIVEQQIGAGAMGEVFKAFDPALARHVAIKTLQASQARTPEDLNEFEQRFYQEAQIYAKLNHPNIVAIFDCGVESKAPFLVMELIDAKPLDIQLRLLGMARFEILLSILEQIANGLHYAHTSGVVHRDIKPGNILLSTQGRIKIIDFGLGKLLDTRMTQAGIFLGTPSYASPEQVMGGKIDHRADVYSFGTLAYELLTGHLPFDSSSIQILLFQIAQAPPRIALEHFANYLDIHLLNEIFERVLHKKPEARYPDIECFFNDLRDALTGLKNIQRDASLTLELLGFPKSAQPRDHAHLSSPSPKRMNQAAIPAEKLFSNHSDKIQATSNSDFPKSSPQNAAEPPRRQRIHATPNIESKASEKQPFATNGESESTQIMQARRQFEAAYLTKNLASVRFSFHELERLGAGVDKERSALAELEAIESKNQQLKEQQQRQKETLKLREQLRLAIEARNLSSSRYCLEELRKQGADVNGEYQAIIELENKLREAETARNNRAAEQDRRRLHVEKLRADFRQAWGMRDLGRLQDLVAQLRQHQANTDSELNALESLRTKLDSEQRQRKVWLEKARAQFQQAIQDRRPDRCQQLIFEMQDLLRVDTSEEKAALLELECRIEEETKKNERLNKTNSLKDSFRTALGRREVNACSKIIKELNGMGELCEKESKALSLLRKQLQEAEESRFKTQLIAKIRLKFQESIERKDMTFSQHYLTELTQLTELVSDEQAALASLKEALQTEEEAQLRESFQQRMLAGFSEAIKSRSLENCRYYLQELHNLGFDVTELATQVTLLEKELEEEQVRRESLVQHARESFHTALQQQDISRSENYLKMLVELDVDVREERRELASFRKKLRQSRESQISPADREKLKSKMIEQFRFEFILAFQEGRTNGCRFYLNELKQLGADVHSEEEAMGHLDE